MMTFVGRCTFTRGAYENGSERNKSHVHTAVLHAILTVKSTY